MNVSIEEAIKADEARNELRKLRAQMEAMRTKRNEKAALVERYKSARNVWPEDSDNYKAQNTQVENHSRILADYEQQLRDLELACSKSNCSSTASQPSSAATTSSATSDYASTGGEIAADSKSGLPLWAYLAIGAAALLVIGALVYFFVLRESTTDTATRTSSVSSLAVTAPAVVPAISATSSQPAPLFAAFPPASSTTNGNF